ncbi:MAG: fatty acid desaturase [Alphaproteobacteria bacterium]|nr:fatty acid desaturase [Alphaproteobacteria bacterium]MDA8003648.1 fatty acid desaturase [Alphaproteobacteria bacterium]MDA8005852.1 fatty acid desaturase [Alphaproteobacteria bacterium]MDA8013979.1 fatty acid desaturase [Alphaproteobacteria bacterium]
MKAVRHIDRILREFPTLALLALAHGGLFALVVVAPPPLLFMPCAVFLVTLYLSLQHELIHGHPTSSARINALLGIAPYPVLYPYEVFRADHLRHHASNLTDPMDDPESFFLTRRQWREKSRLSRVFFVAHSTLAGRLILGPPRLALLLLLRALGDIFRPAEKFVARTDAMPVVAARHWLTHGILLVVWFVWLGVNGVSVWFWLFAVAWPANSLIHLRSYAEHRAEGLMSRRTVTILSPGLFSFLFLNNNFHITHHRHPGLVWWRLPARWRAEYRGGEAVIRGYSRIFAERRRAAVAAPVWPLDDLREARLE